MKKIIFTLTLLYPFLTPLADAREILGLNFCGKVSVDDVKNSLEKNGAKFIKEKVDEDTGVISITTFDYQIADTNAEVEFEIYKDKLFQIVFKDGRIISEILKSKYGLARSSKESGLINSNIFHYNSKDKDIDIFETFAEVSPSLGLRYGGSWHHATYVCKPVDRVLKKAVEQIEKQKQLQKKGANKL